MKSNMRVGITREATISTVVVLLLILAAFGAARGFDPSAATLFSSWFVRKVDLGQCGLPFARNIIGATLFIAMAGVIHLGVLVKCWMIARPWEGKYAKGTFWWCLFFAFSYFLMVFIDRQEGGWLSRGFRVPKGPDLTEACQLSHFWNGAESIFLPGFKFMLLAAFLTWATLIWALVFPKVMTQARPKQ
ncbi:hypothetical protein [Mesorhizobium sp. Cs1299R1N3]|uniref:hypothetical protein n=1 Tax=Mesorhizobium sp. Cs1299R1N3 TaxID=3015173 RepID=UPI00301CD0F6